MRLLKSACAIAAILSFTALPAPVLAKTPPEIMTPYKAYLAAVDAGDEEAAAKQAYKAWQAAETALGDSKMTGDLAQNYADLRLDGGLKERIAAMTRAMALTEGYGAEAPTMYLQRGLSLSTLLTIAEEDKAVRKLTESLLAYAEANGQTNTTFYGEALTNMAAVEVRRRRYKSAVKYSDKALAAFESAETEYVSAHLILANLYRGYGLEADDDTVEAALSYQKVMESIDGMKPQDHPLSARALGRWAHMRSRLETEGKLEEAEQQVLCKCWPYDKPRNEALKPVKRVPPKFPRAALNGGVSGYSIVEFDLDDQGKIINPKILVSWPEGVYDKASLKSLKTWQYTPRTSEETDEDRTELVQTIRYQLQDSSGNLIY